MSDSTPLLYRIQDAMQMLSVSRATIYRMVERGQLKIIKVGTATRITAASLCAFLEPATGADNMSQPST